MQCRILGELLLLLLFSYPLNLILFSILDSLIYGWCGVILNFDYAFHVSALFIFIPYFGSRLLDCSSKHTARGRGRLIWKPSRKDRCCGLAMERTRIILCIHHSYESSSMLVITHWR